jgi:2-polyprenyl-6-hydroxyphenyl methylase/3-demethylubiquinone-9 3-methyltransferase
VSAYYSESLSAERLRRCYELAPPRVQRYLRAEIDFVLDRIRPADSVLELGCGYGRVMVRLIGAARLVVGIDTSADSLRLARETLGDAPGCRFAEMDAAAMTFPDHHFDVVLCIQNGISAFGVDRRTLLKEAIRVTAPGGTVLFSSYSPRFWEDRLEWFRIQSAHGLLGEIDEQATGDGVIVCKDGFRATTVRGEEFLELCAECGVKGRITEVDGSSVFCQIGIGAPRPKRS